MPWFLNKSYTDEDLDVIAMAEFGSRKELFINYYEREIEFERPDVFLFCKNTFQTDGFDGDMIQNTINQAFEFLRSKNPEHIRFLV